MAIDINLISSWKEGCGIATYAANQVSALKAGYPAEINSVAIYPIDNPDEKKPSNILVNSSIEQYRINQFNLDSYERVGHHIGIKKTERPKEIEQIVVAHYEFGLDGRNARGKNYPILLGILKASRIPIYTYLHTTRRKPNAHQRDVIQRLGDLSTRLIVHTDHAENLLKEEYGVDALKVKHIDHGIRLYDKDTYNATTINSKLNLPLETRKLLKFGLRSPNKGDISAIEGHGLAVNEMTPEERENTILIIAGKYHQGQSEKIVMGEREKVKRAMNKYHLRSTYINDLNELEKVIIEKDVIFYEKFLNEQELMMLYGLADISMFSYRDPDQDSSGALADAMGFGKPIIATKFPYAEELLNDRSGSRPGRVAGIRGYLIDLEGSEDKYGLLKPNIEQIALSEKELLDNPQLRKRMGELTYERAYPMNWVNVAGQLIQLIKHS